MVKHCSDTGRAGDRASARYDPPPPPRIFGVDAGFDISSHGVPHSFFAVSVIPCAPTDYKDNFPLGIFMDSFPICAEALGDVPCTTSELDEPIQEALL
jgi:hypothetical protein